MNSHLAQLRIDRAIEALREADLLIADQRWRGAINRLYYAAFHAAKALLAVRNLDTSKHSGTIALFQQHFVKTELVPTDLARGLSRAFDKRQLTDYADSSDPGHDDVRAR
ncbi:MAG: HEPN domain-containing protein [Acidobacteria bacterium]|nr:HEPN domain-containing protein [Acidobacteriota bacterium]